MPNNRKFYPRDGVLFITSSTETGLPFIPNSIINSILEGIIARAQDLYGQHLCHYLFMANHLHLILRITEPENVGSFIGYIKGKSAAAINALLGRSKKTIWCDGFDSPLLLDQKTAIDKISYTYLNPANARLVKSVDEYPGVSSWKSFTTGKHKKRVRWIKPSTISRLPSPSLTHTEEIDYLNILNKKNKKFLDITIEPDSWMEPLGVTKTRISQNKEIIEHVYKEEEQLKGLETHVMGASKLRRQPLDLEHTRKTSGPRSICLSDSFDTSITFIRWFKGTAERARTIFLESKHGTFCGGFPPGFFGPGGTYSASYLSIGPSVIG